MNLTLTYQSAITFVKDWFGLKAEAEEQIAAIAVQIRDKCK